MNPRTGRPTKNPKGESINVRLDEKSKRIIEKYAEQNGITKAEVIRIGVYKLEAELENEG